MADVTVKFGADTAELVAAAEKAQASVASVGQAASTSAAPLKTVGAAMDTAAAEAKTLATNLDQVAMAEKSAGAEAANAGAIISEGGTAATVASKAHEGLAGSLGSNRMAMMEVGHSARAMADGLAAGISPVRLLAMETPRLIQALTELGPGAMAALVSPAAAAVAGVAALAAGLGYLAYEGYASKAGLEAAKEGMLSAGNLNSASIKQYGDDVKNLGTTYGLSASEAKAAAAELGKLKEPAAQYHQQLGQIAIAYAQMANLDIDKAFADVTKAANGGTASFLKWAEGVGFVTERQKEAIAEAGAGHDTLASFGKVVDSISENWGKTASQTKEAKAALADYQRIATALASTGNTTAMPEDFGVKRPSDEEVSPTQGPQAPDPATERRAETEADYNKVLVERQGLLKDIQTLEDAVAKADDPAAKAAAQTALDEARLKATRLHTDAENEGYEKQIAQIHAEAAAAVAGSQEKIDAAKAEQQAIRERNTVRDAQGKIVVDGGDTAAYAEAGARIETAEREHQAKLYQLQVLGIQQRQAAARDDLAQQIALQQELVELARKQSAQDPAALGEAEKHLTELQRQEADKRASINLDGLRRQLTDDATTTAQREALLKQYSDTASAQLNHNSDAYRSAMDYVRDETKRLESDKAQAALADLEVQRRALDQQESAELKVVGRREELGQMTVQAAETAEQQIATAHDAAVAKILTSEEKAAQGIINLAQEVARRKSEIATQEAAQLKSISDKAEDDIAKKAKSSDAEIARSGASTITGLLMGRQSFAQAAEQMLEQMLEKELTTDIEGLLSHSEAEAGKTGATETGVFARLAALVTGTETGKAVEATANSTSVMGSAYKAAAGAYSALAGIPIIGPALGAAAAVTTFAAVAAYNIFSAEGGMGQVPYDGAMFQLHKDEMVLPSWIASPLRAQLAAGGGMGGPQAASGVGGRYGLPNLEMPPSAANSNASAGSSAGAQSSSSAGGGDTHLHITMPPGLVQVTGKMSALDLQDMEAAVTKVVGNAVKTAHRGGQFTGMNRR